MALVTRYKNNPILTKKDVPYEVATVHNAGVTKFNDQYIMLFRSHRHNGRSILGLARSGDGFNFSVDREPFMVPAQSGPFAGYEEYGVEDPRITFIENEFLITYSAYSRHGVRIGLANGGQTRARFMARVPLPHVKCAKETRWYCGKWQKLLKTGWVDLAAVWPETPTPVEIPPAE